MHVNSLQILVSRPEIPKADSCHSMKIGSLQVDCKYPITRAERVGARYGPTITLTIRDSPRILKFFVLRRNYSSFSDTDIEYIYSERVGQSVNTHSLKIAIEKQ